ncbi:restriction endonuclease [Streptomyces sp. NPDC020802]|uniref:restriction endonuclease n=1 Tax=Streptomyces sp. NPDC020802 TaxID=3365094 RepID=UPI0037BB1F9F
MPQYDLDEWRAVMRGEKKQPCMEYTVIAFPNEDIRDAYLDDSSSWPEEEVRAALRNMLGESRSVSMLDLVHLETLRKRGIRNFTEFERRLILSASGKSKEPVWQGISWVLDLLPHSANAAIEAISAYHLAHLQHFSDLRLIGIEDAIALVRHRYITQGDTGLERKISVLRSLHPRDLEFLVGALYSAMGYGVSITSQQKDGGFDVVARRRIERICIECKNWEQKVDVETVRSFCGALYPEHATMGVIVSVSGFTERGPETAVDYAKKPEWINRLELVDGSSLVALLNAHLGSEWDLRADRIIGNQKREATSGMSHR